MAHSRDGISCRTCDAPDGQHYADCTEGTELDRNTRTAWRVTLGDLDEAAGRIVTDDEAEQIAKGLGYSTIWESVEAVVQSVCGFPDDEDEDVRADRES